MIDELRWMIGLNFVLALWLGMLADSWKGRRVGVWMVIGMFTSVLGLIILAWLPKLPRTATRPAPVNGFARSDSYGH